MQTLECGSWLLAIGLHERGYGNVIQISGGRLRRASAGMREGRLRGRFDHAGRYRPADRREFCEVRGGALQAVGRGAGFVGVVGMRVDTNQVIGNWREFRAVVEARCERSKAKGLFAGRF